MAVNAERTWYTTTYGLCGTFFSVKFSQKYSLFGNKYNNKIIIITIFDKFFYFNAVRCDLPVGELVYLIYWLSMF